MKKVFLSMFVALMATVAIQAQQIAVVSSGGTTTIYRTLADAIDKATANSVIYLPGGGFPISDEVKIEKKLTIIGIGHKVKGDNADGYTTISGNLFFNEGSDGSAVLGCYMTGNVKIGSDGKTVNDVLVRYCNLNAVEVLNNTCTGTVVNQNYIRSGSNFHGAEATFTNNVASSLTDLDNGVVSYNIITSKWGSYYPVDGSDNTSVTYNVFLLNYYNWTPFGGSNILSYGNMTQSTDGGDGMIKIDVDWSEVFVNNAGVTPQSDYQFTEKYNKYMHQCGIYAGSTPFSDGQLPPVPYIVAKQIPEQTDAEGKLNIKVRVRAGE